METDGFVFAPVLTEGEVRRCAALADAVWHESYAELLDPAQIDYMVQKFQSPAAIAQNIRQDGYEYYLVESAGQAAGYLALQPKGGRLLLSKCYLLARFRGTQGTNRLFAFVEERAEALGCGAVWLTVNKNNARAIAAYEKRGYQTVRMQVADIGGGFVMDDRVMEKALA